MALSANTRLDLKNRLGQTVLSGTVTTAAVLYHHAMAVRTAAGSVKPAANETTTRFVGLVDIGNPDDSTAGITGDGTLTANMISNVDALVPCVTAITVGNVGAQVYAVDDQTVTTETTLGPAVGIITEFVATNSVWVRFGMTALAAAS